MTDAKNRRKVRNYFLNPRYQLKYIFWITSTGVLLTLFNASVFYHYMSENYLLLVDLAPMTDQAKEKLYVELYQILGILLGFGVAFMALVAVLGFVVSHRTAGPLYQFKLIFEKVRNGNWDARINLRPNDEFRDVAESFNDMMDKLTKKET